VNSAIVTGAGFSVSGATLPTTLNPGQSLALEVQFDPTTAASYSGQLTIGTSVSNPTVALSGTGVSYAVDLSWAAPTGSTDPVVGYNIYRAPNGTTSFQRLNGTIDKLTTFTDSSVQAGGTYNYYVTSVDAQGVESPHSNTFSATVL
jgi:predicted phage tail protein